MQSEINANHKSKQNQQSEQNRDELDVNGSKQKYVSRSPRCKKKTIAKTKAKQKQTQRKINAKQKSKQTQQSEQNRNKTWLERFAAKPRLPSTSEQNRSKRENRSEIVANAKPNQRKT